MAVPSWAEKLTGRGFQKCRRRQLLFSSPPSVSSSPKPLAKEVVLAANLGCIKCQKGAADAISRSDDVESIVVHVLEKKVTITRQALSQGSSSKMAAIYIGISGKASRIAHPSGAFVD